MSEPAVYLMRGLPACGKSYTARTLAGTQGIVLETDEYFYLMVGNDPASYDYDKNLLSAAQQWNFERFREAIRQRIAPIVVDRGNGLNKESQRYARYALEHGYRPILREPNSPWWQEIRALLCDKQANKKQLDEWARRLTELSQKNHRVPISTIRRWIEAWNPELTIDAILTYTN